MTTKAKADDEKAVLEARVKDLEERSRNEYGRFEGAVSELKAARRQIDEQTVKLFAQGAEIANLLREIGRLEGYRARVEHVDRLEHGAEAVPHRPLYDHEEWRRRNQPDGCSPMRRHER